MKSKLESFSKKFVPQSICCVFQSSQNPFPKFSHGFRLQRSITPNMGIIGSIIDDEDEVI
jgi:hypothetical protein